ncbi:MAG: arginyltransferase [Formivibrio sp.]|nr:arginyltransferase [Formivibrio sp.]
MSDSLRSQSIPIQFYATASYPCSYLDGREARSQVAAPADMVDAEVYGQLLQHGFRRSGQFVYRPACDDCHACVPVRIPVVAFQPNRSQQRAGKRHADLKGRVLGLKFVNEHFQLYQRYQAARHPGGGMDLDDREQYENFILKSNVASFLVEFRENGILRMVSLIDQVDDGLSSAYTFFEPGVPGTSYGVCNILWQIGLARQLRLPYLYLGYWIGACRKMAYKTQYRPLEGLVGGKWQLLEPDGTALSPS